MGTRDRFEESDEPADRSPGELLAAQHLLTEEAEDDFEPRKTAGILGYMDGLLRHRDAYFKSIFRGDDIVWHLGRMLTVVVALGVGYGVVMGAMTGIPEGFPQMLSSAVKTPLLFLLTLAVCYPVLYVVNVVMGSRLSFLQTLALIVMAIAMIAILLASCAPIVLFFTLIGTSYNFLKLLHVAIFGFSGLWAMFGLWRGLVAMCEHSSLYPRQALRILYVWVFVFAFVGTQCAWTLRPFIGSPGAPFEIFRSYSHMNFYEAVMDSMVGMVRGLTEDSPNDAAEFQRDHDRRRGREVPQTQAPDGL